MSGSAPARLGPKAILGLFVGATLVIALFGGGVALLNSPTPPTPTPGDSPPVATGEPWRSPSLGYSFKYDPNQLQLAETADDLAVFNTLRFDAQVIVRGAPASVTPPDLIVDGLQIVDGFMIGRISDPDDYDALIEPTIGDQRGEGGVFAGTLLASDGTPVAPGGVTILAATDGRITVAMLVIVARPDLDVGARTHQHVVRSLAEGITKSFDWGQG